MAAALRVLLLTVGLLGWASGAESAQPKPIPFVVQMTAGDSDAQRRAFLQISKVLADIGPRKVKIEVVAYEEGITSLLADNNTEIPEGLGSNTISPVENTTRRLRPCASRGMDLV